MPELKVTLTFNSIKKFNLPQENLNKKDITNLHSALKELDIPVDPAEINRCELGDSTKAAIKKFQEHEGLPADGTLSPRTVEKIKAELEHSSYVNNKTRTENIQLLLKQVGHQIEGNEIKNRRFGPSTEKAIQNFREKIGLLSGDSHVDETVVRRLKEEALNTRFTTKTQVGKLQRDLLRINRISKLAFTIDANELKKKEFGTTTRAAIGAFQKKYNLEATGDINLETYERMLSVVNSRPLKARMLNVKSAKVPPPVNRVLRLNMVNKHVGDLQQTLAFLGYKIDENEFNTKTFGKTTRAAVIEYQRAQGLPLNGNVGGETLKRLNLAVKEANPEAFKHSFRVRGSIRDSLWHGKAGIRIQLFEKALRGEGSLLAERNSYPDGFFDIPYDPPRNSFDGQIKVPFHLQIRILDQNNNEIGRKVIFNPTLISWLNFTEGDQPYRGTSEFGERLKAVTKVLSGVSIADIEETEQRQEVTHVALNSGLSQEDVMRLVLSHKVAQKINNVAVGPDVIYAFIAQNLPANLPSNLLASTNEWESIDNLVEQTANGLVFMESDLQSVAFDNAIKENLVPITVVKQKDAILAALSSLKQNFALEKPILVGNGSLKSLLGASQLAQEHYGEIANTFLKYKGVGSEFLADVKARSAQFGGDSVIKDLETTISLGQIAKNHVPTISFLKTKFNTDIPAGSTGEPTTKIKTDRDWAKLRTPQWVALIKENGSVVPDVIDGNTLEEKIEIFAKTLESQSERLFPTIAFTAEVKRSNEHSLSKINEIEQLVDNHEDLDLGLTNIDSYVKEKNIDVAEDVLSQARVMQRVRRIAPTADLGRALLDEKIHHSAAIVSMGKENFVKTLQKRGIEQPLALTIYGLAESRYAEVLTKIADYRFEIHRSDPRAIVSHTDMSEDEKKLIEGIPTLKTLFGSLDFCECKHCQSVYSPPAYVADLLRFLSNHDSKAPGKKVKDILFNRRPDIGNIKLNCDNTDTPLPYVDLVCEILENAVPAPSTNTNFNFQTSRTPEELRAFPDNVRKEAYDLLKEGDYPMNICFNLWQEEARVFLQHLGISRYELMEILQASSSSGGSPPGGLNTPTDLSIAGEFWNISSHETGIITSPENTTLKQDHFWGFSTATNKVPVAEFIQHAKMDYAELLELPQVQWLSNPAGPIADQLRIEPLGDNNSSGRCNIDNQSLAGLNIDKFDKIHRFIRLLRHTEWKMWELDLLIRSPKIGNGAINDEALIHLKQFKQVQQKIGAGVEFESVLSFYHQINTEVRVKSDETGKEIQPLYNRLFQNPAVTNPVDDKFALPISGSEKLSDHKTTLLAALAITEPDLSLLVEKTDNKLNLLNLTAMFNYVTLANGLKISIKELLTLQNLLGMADVFASPKQTLDLIGLYEWIKDSGFVILELDYLLNHRPNSPYGLSEEVITQYIQILREDLRANSAAIGTKQGQVISNIANTFVLTDEQSRLLLEKLTLQSQNLLHHLADDARLTERNSSNDAYSIEITPTSFPRIYESYRLLHKASMLIQRHKIADKNDLQWLLTKYATFKFLNFSELPISSDPAQSLFETWLNLYKWLNFRQKYPQPEDVSLRLIFVLAENPATNKDVILSAISKLTTWNVTDLNSLHTGLHLNHGNGGGGGAASDYANVETYIHLLNCFRLIKRTGVGANTLLSWAKRDDDANGEQFVTAWQIRQAAKSKYDYGAWLSIVTPIQDQLREKKRNALINYLVEHSLRTEQKEITFEGKQFANAKYWKDFSDLLSYFLIDVEMGSCQLTSRIKQAISSIQMFVQRCFLNLEQPYVEVSHEEREDTVSLDSWKQWKWIKNYRIWEANRKVFLYPENWIEPALRDDKSQFFEELENEIMQNEITNENAEAAFLHYLQNVQQVSRLDIAGFYHEIDDDNPYDNLPPSINLLHVIGRTKSQPATYYYRQFDMNYNTWTAWEKIDLDITGDHVIPVVYNRKLYLFWLVFTRKPQKVKKHPPAKLNNDTTTPAEPPNILEIQLAWSVRKQRGWTSRKLSNHKLIHPWDRPLNSYNLKPRYKSRENLLWLDIYISTSLQFNNNAFYDPYTNSPRRLTAMMYDETARPWHSSSFIFDGEVVDLKLKALAGQYRILGSDGIPSDQLFSTTSYQYVRDNFDGQDDRSISKLEGGYEIAPRLPLPDGMHYHNTHLANNTVQRINPNRLNVLESGATRTLLEGGQSSFELVFSQDRIKFDTTDNGGQVPLFYQDSSRAFFIKPEWQQMIEGYGQVVNRLKHTFYSFYHPYAALFIRELNRSGIEGLLKRKLQLYPNSYYPGNSFSFTATYRPKALDQPDETAEHDVVDFSQYGAYSIYNWEIFFHAPFMIACKLSQNQRFEEAMQWFHYIFDPINTEALSVPQRYWITKPFFEQNSDSYRKQRIENLLENITDNLDQIRAWKNNPFKPHLIARYRPIAYQKAIVMKYIDNLIAWGDYLFRQDTLESINQATMLYVLAYELLGPRPVKMPNLEHKDLSYNELVAAGPLDPFGNKRVEALMENFTSTSSVSPVTRTLENAEPLPNMDIFYFCLPANDNLLKYWDTIQDRLFKIRHCMNIEGVVRQLPLFEPPIDPALLVKAAAAGVDLSSVLSNAAAPMSQYRFRILSQKAAEFCNEVKALGDKLLSVLEKKDAEGLALLRSVNEIKLLEAAIEVKKQQINEAKELGAGLEKGIDALDKRIEYYGSIPRMNDWEKWGAGVHGLGIAFEIVATVLNTVAGGTHLIPQIKGGATGMGGSPTLTVEMGGKQVADSSAKFAAMFTGLASIAHQGAQMLETQGSYTRHDEENRFQKELAEKEKPPLEKQIEAAKIRISIAEKELENHELQIEQAKAIDEYMRNKYTNQQLYDWMLKQLSTVYFQSYQLAYDMAKRAEKCFQFELGKPNASFIEFGYWDSLKKGLLAGERLVNDIHRMETAYFDEDKRELEITKNVSLAQFMPLDLLKLKENGECTITLPEWLYDMDYLGHYRRRIKSVSITIPCVVGPYTSINCTLSLTGNGIRVSDDVTGGYGDPLSTNSTQFMRNPVPIASIATSHGQNDAGMFELNFNDDHYLPFEGAGAVSQWQIQLPKESNQFDFATISDVILHIKYTAVKGSTSLHDEAKRNLETVLPSNGLMLLILNNEFSTEWHRFLHPDNENNDQELSITLKPEHLPFYAYTKSVNKHIYLTRADIILESPFNGDFDATLQLPGANTSSDESVPRDSIFGGMPHLAKTTIPPQTNALGDWKIKLKKNVDSTYKSLKREDIMNAYLVVGFEIQ